MFRKTAFILCLLCGLSFAPPDRSPENLYGLREATTNADVYFALTSLIPEPLPFFGQGGPLARRLSEALTVLQSMSPEVARPDTVWKFAVAVYEFAHHESANQKLVHQDLVNHTKQVLTESFSRLSPEVKVACFVRSQRYSPSGFFIEDSGIQKMMKQQIVTTRNFPQFLHDVESVLRQDSASHVNAHPYPIDRGRFLETNNQFVSGEMRRFLRRNAEFVLRDLRSGRGRDFDDAQENFLGGVFRGAVPLGEDSKEPAEIKTRFNTDFHLRKRIALELHDRAYVPPSDFSKPPTWGERCYMSFLDVMLKLGVIRRH